MQNRFGSTHDNRGEIIRTQVKIESFGLQENEKVLVLRPDIRWG